jgi:tRNA-specific 2-thiouridylase
MNASKKKVFAAISGGVDSSTAAAVLLQRGYEVDGIFMLTCEASRSDEIRAVQVAEILGIKLHVLDMRHEFQKVLDYFCSEYRQGRTPNPCVVCNRLIKFEKLWQFAQDKGAKYFSTGHYVCVRQTPDGFGLYESPSEKDQSYALAMIDRKILPHLIFPMGDYSKDQTRQLSRQFGLGTSEHKESQEICFIPDDGYTALLEKFAPELVRDGDIIDTSGQVLGTHHGIHRYTIGQRRGLGIAMGQPCYVVRIDAENNTVTLGPKEQLMHKKLLAKPVNWLMDQPDNLFRAKVKIRYNDKGAPATVHIRGEQIEAEFDTQASAVTPGQLAAVYIEGNGEWQLAGGAWIERWSD